MSSKNVVAKKYVIATGKRKTAVARVVIKPGIGRVRINGVPLEIWEPELARLLISEPLLLLDEETRHSLDINVNVRGGGFMAQAQAVRTAIARGLVEALGDEELRRIYMEYDRSMLVGDPRQAEPKKPLGHSARAKKQTSYR